ncbi:myomegalin-like isoform X2 [Pongo abelii]|uniref:myomegalin-like isoform X2 n=1 Tax=Pongo abelii TaxID=9601 RepID=UPI0023E8FB08|nr:myomegalin-like isoform X2 [Pongo abelii]
MSQQKAGMHQPSEKKGPAEKGVNEQKPRPEEAEFSVSCSGKYHSLIQDQARELTHLRQKMKLGRVASALLIQHVKNTLKTFEELLHSNNVDHYMEQHFCEQLAKGSQLAESLARKFSTDKLAAELRKIFSLSQGPKFTGSHSYSQVTFQPGVLLCNHHLKTMTESGLADDCTSKKNQVGQVPSTLSILRKMHNMSKVTEVLETKWDARSQTQPQIWCSNHTQSTPHHSLSSTSPQLDKEEVHPSVAVVRWKHLDFRCEGNAVTTAV